MMDHIDSHESLIYRVQFMSIFAALMLGRSNVMTHGVGQMMDHIDSHESLIYRVQFMSIFAALMLAAAV